MRDRAELVASCDVAGEHRDGSRVQRDQAHLGVLAGDAQHADVQVHVCPLEGQSLSDAKAGHREQADEGLLGGGCQWLGERLGRMHQRRDLLR